MVMVSDTLFTVVLSTVAFTRTVVGSAPELSATVTFPEESVIPEVDDKVTAFVLCVVKFTLRLGMPVFELSITKKVKMATSDLPLPPAPFNTIDLSLGTAETKLMAEGIAAGGALTAKVADVVIAVLPAKVTDALTVPAPVPTPGVKLIFAMPLLSVNAVPLAGDNAAVAVSIVNVTTTPTAGAPALSNTVTFASNALIPAMTLLETPF